MHTVQLLLKTSKYERHEIDRRFHALAHLHNVCVKHILSKPIHPITE